MASKLYAWKKSGKYYNDKGWTGDINKAELHHNKCPLSKIEYVNKKEIEVEVTLSEVGK